jgi:Uma2 family endonuclease
MPAQTQHRFTVQDYYRMAESGVLKPDARVELLEGKIIDMSPIGPFHGGVTKCLNAFFTQTSKDRWIVSVQDPLHLSDHSEPQPDLMLLKPKPDHYASRHPRPEDVFLLIEVADSSLGYDRHDKLPVYARAGIAEVWIVNLIEKVIEIHREPHFAGYSSQNVLRAGEKACPAAFPDAAVDIDALLNPQK